MKTINNGRTAEIVAELRNIVANHSMTLEEQLNLIGAEIINDSNDEDFSDDGDNIIWNGKRFYFDDIEEIMNQPHIYMLCEDAKDGSYSDKLGEFSTFEEALAYANEVIDNSIGHFDATKETLNISDSDEENDCWDENTYAVEAYVVRDSEAGNIIEQVSSMEKGLELIEKYEESDRAEGTYEEGFYECVELR